LEFLVTGNTWRVFFVRFYFIIDAVVFIQTVGVSAATGDGLPEFFSAIDAAAAEYERLLAH